MSSDAPLLPPGTLLAGRFRVGRVLGAGGMGAVYEIEHELTKHRRALKLLHPRASASPEIVARFLREASAAGRIGNPHVVEVFDAGSLETGAPYVVMELLAGETLGGLLARKGKLDLPEICALVGQACEGVQAAHDAGIVHRDLKPENLFVTSREGTPFVKILDFGVSKWSAELSAGAAVTREGAAIGTPLYMAPEQIWGAPDIDARADVYALGVILYECAAGAPPYQAASLAHLAVLVHEGNPVPLATLRPDLPAAFHDLVGRAMAKDKADRLPSARALREALRAPDATQRPDPLAATEVATTAPSGAGRGEAPTPALSSAGRGEAPTAVERAGQDGATGQGEATGGAAAIAVPRARTWWRWAALAALAGGAAGAGVLLWPRLGGQAPAPAAPGPPAPPTGARPGGRLPPEYLQEVVRRHMDAFSACYDAKEAPRRAVIRTLQWVIDVDGSVRDAYTAELDPSTTAFDECLVDKVKALRFPKPEGGIITVAYPFNFARRNRAPLDDEACSLTPGCFDRGTCAAREGECVVLRDSDCVLSRLCTQRGQCVAENGRCVAPAQCGPDSPACAAHGLCATQGGRCVAAADTCARSRACAVFGQCEARDGHCAAASDEQCARSDECSRQGKCGESGGWCGGATADTCRASSGCRELGRCSLRVGECAALRDEDCRSSHACTHLGQCGASKIARCVAKSAEDCGRSTQCQKAGACALVGNRCELPP